MPVVTETGDEWQHSLGEETFLRSLCCSFFSQPSAALTGRAREWKKEAALRNVCENCTRGRSSEAPPSNASARQYQLLSHERWDVRVLYDKLDWKWLNRWKKNDQDGLTENISAAVTCRILCVTPSRQPSLSVRLIGSPTWCEEWCPSPSVRPPAAQRCEQPDLGTMYVCGKMKDTAIIDWIHINE